MQIKYILLIGAICFAQSFSYGQNKTAIVVGKVTDNKDLSVPGALIKIQNSTLSSITDVNGDFRIKLPTGKQTLLISSVGMLSQQKEIDLEEGEVYSLNIKLAEHLQQLQAVKVYGRTQVQEINRQAFNVTAIDAEKLYNSTLDISGALDRVSGIRVRESGGVGSNFNLSLNGFSGNHIKYFIDGIPMDNFGSAFQINNIPVNLAERIEVYKGVVPMWLGSDALGGAVNIITGDRYSNYLDASYSFGSFNTHRSVINAAITSPKGLTLQLNAFQNYSDNNYKVVVDAADINTGAYTPNTSLNRFHDTYHNETFIANVGVVNKNYADKLLFGITLGKNYKEIQTGARMVSVFGGWHRTGNIIMPSIKYKKDNLIKGLDVTFNANYNLGSEKSIDTLNVRYDWFGNFKENGSSGERSRSVYKYKNHNGLATSMLNYRLNERQSIALSNVFNTFNREGVDLLNPQTSDTQPLKITHKNILGLGYNFNQRDKISATVFGKYIYQNTVNGSRSNNAKVNKVGYGTAISYFINRNLQLKASYELTNKMPDANEIFGDVENQEANPNLKPEISDNINLGVIYGFKIDENNRFSITANGIYRYAKDFIYNRFNNNQSKLVADNRDGVMTYGGDAEIRYSYKNWLSAGATATYQYLQNMQKIEPGYTGVSPLYKDQMPNIPYLFGNTDVSVSLKNVGKRGNQLNIGYNLLYVHEFYLYWPSRGSEKLNIPRQLSHDINVVYSLAKGKYNIGLEAKNISDALLYDNFSLQKPSRGFYLNLRYFLNKIN